MENMRIVLGADLSIQTKVLKASNPRLDSKLVQLMLIF